MKNVRNTSALLLLLLAGVVVGGLIGELASRTPALHWLSVGQTFGLTSPLTLDLGVLVISFGLTIRFTVASLIGIILAFIIYRKL